MGLNRRAPEGMKGKSNIPLLEVGEYEGRLVMVADLGLQRKEFKGEYKGDVQQISLGIELIGQTYELETSEGVIEKPHLLWTKPFYIYDTAGEKSKELEFYSVFDRAAKKDCTPDWEAQLGKPCNVLVDHKESAEGGEYSFIKSLSPIPEKYQSGVGEATIDLGIGDIDDADNPVNKALYGLARFVFENRVDANAPTTEGASSAADDDPF